MFINPKSKVEWNRAGVGECGDKEGAGFFTSGPSGWGMKRKGSLLLWDKEILICEQ